MDSYGLIACQLARHLAGLGCRVNLMALGNARHPHQDADIAAVTHQPIVAAFGAIHLGYPTTYRLFPAITQRGPRLALTMFESSKVPSGWVEVLNGYDAVLTPSTFCRDVFVSGGVTAPIHVIPLGISPTYRYVRRADGPLTFLAFIDRGMRKGGIQAMQAFVAAFGEDMNYRLILKGRESKYNAEILNPNIEVIQQDMSEQELYQLYLRCHVLINPHRGEGFGLIPREFCQSGGLALTTAWSGTADDLDKWGIGLGYKLVKADWRGHPRLSTQDLGVWAEPDHEGLVAWLRRIADNWVWYRAQTRQYAANAQRLYNWRTFAERVLEVWEEVADGKCDGHRQAA